MTRRACLPVILFFCCGGASDDGARLPAAFIAARFTRSTCLRFVTTPPPPPFPGVAAAASSVCPSAAELQVLRQLSQAQSRTIDNEVILEGWLYKQARQPLAWISSPSFACPAPLLTPFLLRLLPFSLVWLAGPVFSVVKRSAQTPLSTSVVAVATLATVHATFSASQHQPQLQACCSSEAKRRDLHFDIAGTLRAELEAAVVRTDGGWAGIPP